MQPLSHARLLLAHQARRSFAARVPVGTTLADIETPEFWKHLAQTLRVGDRVEVVADDGSFDGDVRVVAKTEQGVSVRVLHMATVEEAAEEPATAEEITAEALERAVVSFAPKHRWRISIDDKVISKDHPDKPAAEAELERLKAAG